MVDYLMKVIKSFRLGVYKKRETESTPKEPLAVLSSDLAENTRAMSKIFLNSGDFIMRRFTLEWAHGLKGAIMYIDGMTDAKTIDEFVLRPLLSARPAGRITGEELMGRLPSIITAADLSTTGHFEPAVAFVTDGNALMMIDGTSTAMAVMAPGYEKRAISEPQTDTVIRGPREGFIESLRSNTSLLRRRLRDPNLRIEEMRVGYRTSTPVAVIYLANVANPDLVKEVKRRLESIKVDGTVNMGSIESFLDDAPWSVFSTVGASEKPDVIAAKILEGRVSIVVDGSPFVLTAPMLLVENFQSVDDYTAKTIYATVLRIMRMAAFIVSITMPSIYVALATFQQELIPTPLLFTMAATREGLPFATSVEVPLMLFIYEVLREAGIRLPRPAGQAVSIVGALVMGQAAVSAGIVGAPVVIVISMSAVAAYVTPNLSDAISLMRWMLLIASIFFGGFGITVGLVIILAHITSLKSFKTPYCEPFAPFTTTGELHDSLLRSLYKYMTNRPSALKPLDKKRSDMKGGEQSIHASRSIDD